MLVVLQCVIYCAIYAELASYKLLSKQLIFSQRLAHQMVENCMNCIFNSLLLYTGICKLLGIRKMYKEFLGGAASGWIKTRKMGGGTCSPLHGEWLRNLKRSTHCALRRILWPYWQHSRLLMQYMFSSSDVLSSHHFTVTSNKLHQGLQCRTICVLFWGTRKTTYQIWDRFPEHCWKYRNTWFENKNYFVFVILASNNITSCDSCSIYKQLLFQIIKSLIYMNYNSYN